ncbi:MAG: DUF4962 domain-containing protein [Planctomycetota bacterium]
MRHLRLTLLVLAVHFSSGAALGEPASKLGHPRLYFTADDLAELRRLRHTGMHATIWNNLRESADWCLTRTPRKEWIAPVAPDPIYENLYDRFYAIMGDLAITEHLAFAYAIGGDRRHGEAGRDWVLANCRAWQREADGAVDGGKAYAVCRLLKGVAVGYDLLYDQFSEAEQEEVRATLARIARKYYADYFTTPAIAGPGFHTHHAIVEWASFGVVALALLGEEPEARDWLEATVKKFEEHLLPTGLAADGAQTEGATFWASTMHYRLFFMDALRRVTGRDLFEKHEKFMQPDLALASIAAEKRPGHNRPHQTVILSPSYGQLDYYAPVLLALAREYRRPVCQHLAFWDHSLGRIQQTRYVTPHGEQLLFELGGYAYVWLDPSVPAEADHAKLSYGFPSVDEWYVRASWQPGDLVAGLRKDQLVVHAGGQPVLVSQGMFSAGDLPTKELEDDGTTAVIRSSGTAGEQLTIALHRPGRLVVRRRGTSPWQWWSDAAAVRDGDTVAWKDRARLNVKTGTIEAWEPGGHVPVHAVGNGRLALVDPAPEKYPLATVRPSDDGETVIEIQGQP